MEEKESRTVCCNTVVLQIFAFYLKALVSYIMNKLFLLNFRDLFKEINVLSKICNYGII